MTAKFDIKAEIAEGYKLIGKMTNVTAFALIGSALYLPDASDVDFAVLIDEKDPTEYAREMQFEGWGNCGDYDTDSGDWAAIRRGNINLMITDRLKFFEDYVTAMEVCRVLNLKEKHQRVAVCQIVRDGLNAEDAWSKWTPMQLAAVKPFDVSDL